MPDCVIRRHLKTELGGCGGVGNPKRPIPLGIHCGGVKVVCHQSIQIT